MNDERDRLAAENERMRQRLREVWYGLPDHTLREVGTMDDWTVVGCSDQDCALCAWEREVVALIRPPSTTPPASA